MENNVTTTDNGKTAAIISYITIIGWLIAYFAMHKDNKTALGSYHLRQSLLLHLGIIAINVALTIIIMIIPIMILAYVSWAVLYAIYLIFIVIGAISANNNEQKPLPIIGEMAQKMFPSI